MEYSKVPQEIFNKVNENVKSLGQLFPSAVKDGEVDFEALKEALGEHQEVSKEKYELTWVGKQNAKKIADVDVLGRTLKFIPEDSKDADITENLYIEGDNLEVLKLLRQNYYNSIKMIYIDPPYNTGNDFVYHDNFKMSERKSAELEGEIIDNERLIINQKNSNRFHANWLNMLYPRLKVAKDLLNDDGLLFMSIDENELKNARSILDEIFGEDCFIASFIWKRRQNVDSRSKNGVSQDHEYILCFGKMSSGRIRGSEKDFGKYSNPDNDPRGDWMSDNMIGLATKEQRPNLHYNLVNPVTKIVYACPTTGWRYEKKRMEQLISNNEVLFPKNPNGRPRRKKFVKDLESDYTGYSTILKAAFNAEATREVRALFDGIELFDFPKPVDLIKKLIEQGTDKDSLILDFFSGSATTAHAIMQLNAEDSGNRKFITVQIPEKVQDEQHNYPTITEIGKDRIRRAGEKIKEENAAKTGIESLDVGFKVFRIEDTNIRWTHEALGEGQMTANEAELTDKDMLDFMPGFTDLDVVYEIMLRQRDIPLSSKVEQLSDIGARTYMFADSYTVCLEETVTEELIEKLAAMEPLPIKFVFRDSAFEDDISLKDETFRRLQLLIARNTGEEKRTYTVEFL
ncbi:site-specific DNA-methyltransferase [Peribacillus sp. NPDC096622]|uniref:site-specific DNA-methyltransferase n=1 Tax=Peribacillus sp. NPDC096622 TaxID=3364396 RepID=UPI0038048010